MTIPFISRHRPTAAQSATVAHLGVLEHAGEIVFERGRCAAQIDERLGSPAAISDTDGLAGWGQWDRSQPVALVAPTWAMLELLNADFQLIEFVNEPSARARGVFICRGAFLHQSRTWLDLGRDFGSEWFPCPIPPTEQEESALAPTPRG